MPMRLSLLLCCALIPAPLLAQDDAPVVLDPITLQAGLRPILESAYGRAHTVLTADDLARQGATTVADALRRVPGLAVSDSGHGLTALRIRGGEGNHTLVLIDGVRASAGDGEYYFSGLDLTAVERIEVLRGPQSVFFGADASSGVVNIITRKGGPGRSARLSVEGGNGYAASAFVSQRDDRGGVALNLSRRDDHGFDISGSGGEKDGLRRNSAQISADYALTDTLTMGGMLRRASEDYDYDAENWPATSAEDYLIDSDDRSARMERAGQIWLDHQMLDGRLLHRLSFDRTQYDFNDNKWVETEARTDLLKLRSTYGLDGAADAASQTLSFGLERRRDENSLASQQNRRTVSAVMEYRAAFASGLDVQLGLRHDDNDLFKDKTSWSLGLSWQLPQAPLRLHASAGTGIVNPTYLELFGGYGYVGNPDLRPEENRGFDLGVEASLLDGQAILDVTIFRDDLENEIQPSELELPDGTNYYNQSGTSKRRGVEISGEWRATDALTLTTDYTYLDATEPDGSVEVRRPRHQFGLGVDYLVAEGRGSLSAELLHVSGNHDGQPWSGYQKKELPSYTLVNVAGGYDLTDQVRLTGRVTNLFDRDHEEVWGYATRGRAAYLGLVAAW